PVAFLVIIFGLRFPGLLSSVRGLGQGPAAAMLGLIPAWVLLFSLSISLGLTAVSLEGKGIWIFAASPNTTLRLLQGKCWSTALPTSMLVALWPSSPRSSSNRAGYGRRQPSCLLSPRRRPWPS